MSKTIPNMKVQDIPPFDSVRELSVSERKRYGLYLSGGGLNDYRIAMATGQGGSVKDSTWNKPHNKHTCCNSRVAWRHKSNCELLKFEDEL